MEDGSTMKNREISATIGHNWEEQGRLKLLDLQERIARLDYEHKSHSQYPSKNTREYLQKLFERIKDLEAEHEGIQMILEEGGRARLAAWTSWEAEAGRLLNELYFNKPCFGVNAPPSLSVRLMELTEEIKVLEPWEEYRTELLVERDVLASYLQEQSSRKSRPKLPAPRERPATCQTPLDLLPAEIMNLREDRANALQDKIEHRTPKLSEEGKSRLAQDPLFQDEEQIYQILREHGRQRQTTWYHVRFWLKYLIWSTPLLESKVLFLEEDRYLHLHHLRQARTSLETWKPYVKKLRTEKEELVQAIKDTTKRRYKLRADVNSAQKLEREIAELREAIKQQKINERLQRKAQEMMADDTAFHERAHKEGLVHTVEEMTAIQEQLATAQTWQPYAQRLEKDVQTLRKTNDDQTKELAKIPDLEQKIEYIEQEKNQWEADAHRIEGERDSWKRIAVQWQTYVQENGGQRHRGKNSVRLPPRTPEEERREQERRRQEQERREQERQERIARKRAEAQERRRQEQERRDAEAREQWKERALREVEQKERRVRDLEIQITNLVSRISNLECGRGHPRYEYERVSGRGSSRNEDKIARLRDKYQGLEERKRRLNDEIIRIQTGLYG